MLLLCRRTHQLRLNSSSFFKHRPSLQVSRKCGKLREWTRLLPTRAWAPDDTWEERPSPNWPVVTWTLGPHLSKDVCLQAPPEPLCHLSHLHEEPGRHGFLNPLQGGLPRPITDVGDTAGVTTRKTKSEPKTKWSPRGLPCSGDHENTPDATKDDR